MAPRLDCSARRARALEGVVMYRPGAAAPLQPPPAGGESRSSEGSGDPSERRSRRRRRRPRRRGDRGDTRQDSPASPEAPSGGSEAPQSDAGRGGDSLAADTSSDS
jgi:hypothetical protein